jgi:hypothetical protein
MVLITTVQQLWHTLHPLRNSTHNRLYNQSQSFHSFLFSIQLVLFGPLHLRILIQLMSIFLQGPEYQMILNKLIAFLMTQSMIVFIALWHSQLQMSLSLTNAV